MILIALCLNIMDAEEVEKENIRTINLGDNAVLIIQYRNYGTRSEGQTGILKIDGKEVIGIKDDKKNIHGIELTNYGDKMEFAWQTLGWNYSDKNKIKYSWVKE